MRSLFFVILVIVNIFYFRKSKYLTDYQIYSFWIFFAAIFYILGEFLRALVTSRGELKNLTFNYIVFALMSPFFRLFTDPIILVRSIYNKDKKNVLNLFQSRMYEIGFLLIFSLTNLAMYRNELFQWLAYGAVGYFIIAFVFLVLNKVKLWDFRVCMFNIVILILQVSAFSIVTKEAQGVFKPWEYLTQYYPFIIPELKISFFSQFILGLLVLSLFNFNYDSKKSE